VIAFILILSLALITGIVYAIVILAFTYGWFLLKETKYQLTDSKIKVSVIVPFRNERENLESILECLMKQAYPAEFFEVILIDDHSSDSGYKIAGDFIETNKLTNSKVLSLEAGDGISKKAALQKGIANSTGELIITTDADCKMGEFWISTIVDKYLTERSSMISAPVCIIPDKSFFSKLQTLEFFSLIGSGAGAIAIHRSFLANGANLCFTRKLYDELKGYSNNSEYASGDDVFMLLQAKQKHNISFLKDKAAIVYTKGAANLKTFLHQRIRWASKSSGYKDATALFTAWSVFLLNFMIALTFGLGFMRSGYFLMAGSLFILKLTVDFAMFYGVAAFLSLRKLMWLYFPLQIFYTIYIIGTAVLSRVVPFEWKDRKLRK